MRYLLLTLAAAPGKARSTFTWQQMIYKIARFTFLCPKTGAKAAGGMKAIKPIFLTIGLLADSASLNSPRAEDFYVPAENYRLHVQAPGAARNGVTASGEVHMNAFNKPCLAFNAASKARLVDKNIFDYIVAAINKCPITIKVRICQRDGLGCNSAAVPAYKTKDVAMGFGPNTTFFDYVVKETP